MAQAQHGVQLNECSGGPCVSTPYGRFARGVTAPLRLYRQSPARPSAGSPPPPQPPSSQKQPPPRSRELPRGLDGTRAELDPMGRPSSPAFAAPMALPVQGSPGRDASSQLRGRTPLQIFEGSARVSSFTQLTSQAF